MSSSSQLSSQINLEFLRKEAKSLLKDCRAQDSAAIARVRAQIPRAEEIKLADVQHVLARERGYTNWAELRHLASPEKWRRSFTCTIRPDMLSPLVEGREYRLSVFVSRRIESGAQFTDYGSLYRRAKEIAAARISELAPPVHHWIVAQSWWWNDPALGDYLRPRSPHDAAAVALAIGLSATEAPAGEDAPSDDALTKPALATPEIFGAQVYDRAKVPQLDEMYTEHDHTDAADSRSLVTFSYGEYVPSCDGIDFAPFVQRAEHRAQVVYGNGRVVRREWWCVTTPNMVCVDLYLNV